MEQSRPHWWNYTYLSPETRFWKEKFGKFIIQAPPVALTFNFSAFQLVTNTFISWLRGVAEYQMERNKIKSISLWVGSTSLSLSKICPTYFFFIQNWVKEQSPGRHWCLAKYMSCSQWKHLKTFGVAFRYTMCLIPGENIESSLGTHGLVFAPEHVMRECGFFYCTQLFAFSQRENISGIPSFELLYTFSKTLLPPNWAKCPINVPC